MRIRTLKCGVFLLLLGCMARLQAQDLHFSQFWATPLLQNPANTGIIEGDWRAAAIYRDQWRSIDGQPFATIGASYDQPIFWHSRIFGVGLAIADDRSGYGNLHSTRAYLSGSYASYWKRHLFSGGIQAGLVRSSVDLSSLSFNSQYDHGGASVFNTSFDNGETAAFDPQMYLDVNAGGLWMRQLNERWKMSAGIAFWHINRPSQSFTGRDDDDTRLPMRTVVNVGAACALTPKLEMRPRLHVMSQKGSRTILAGGTAHLGLPAGGIFNTIYAGPFFRYGLADNWDSFIVAVGTTFKNFDLGLSYDANVSSLSQATSYRGAFEISLIYIRPSSLPIQIQVPCDRY